MKSLFLFISAALSPIAFRCVLLWEKSLRFSLADARGILCDVAVAAIFLTIVVIVTRKFKGWGAVPLYVLWILANQGSYEHVKTLDSLPRFRDLGMLADPVFLKGSVLTVSHPVLLLIIAGCSIVMVIVVKNATFSAVRMAAFGAGLSLVTFALPSDPLKDEWRGTHLFAANLSFWRGPQANIESRVTPREVERLFAADLNGTPILALPQREMNVLMIAVEGASGAYIKSLADPAIVDRSVRMPMLDKDVVPNSLSYRWFIAQQRQTNRGEYSLLCGVYPRFMPSQAEMTEAVAKEKFPICLPSVLRQAGYDTHYLQSAPLSFMFKDQFMPKAGFNVVEGTDLFDTFELRGDWGVDDRALFSRARGLIEKKKSSQKPWFLMLLTAGTHHPYPVPKSYASGSKGTPMEQAFGFADLALTEFIHYLRSSGVLQRTLVLITSDESAGHQENADEPAGMLAENLGLLLVLTPEGKVALIHEPFMMSDVALSVVDYLGLYRASDPFVGRSIFRHYSEPRLISFANYYKNSVGAFVTPERMVRCRSDVSDCISIVRKGGKGYIGSKIEGGADTALVTNLKHVVARTMVDRAAQASEQTIPLLARNSVVTLRNDPREVFLSQVHIPAGSEVEIEFDVSVESAKDSATLFFNVKAEERYPPRTVTVGPGKHWKLRERFGVTKEVPEALIYLHAGKGSRDPIRLRVHEARVLIRPVGKGDLRTELRVLEDHQ